MRVIHLYMLIAVLIGGLYVVAQSMSTEAQLETNISVPQVNTPTVTATPVPRTSGWLSVVPNKTTLVAGETLTLQFTVTNKYDDPLYRAGLITQSVAITGTTYTPSDTNYTYQQNQCYTTTSGGVNFGKRAGAFRVLAGYVGWDAGNANKTATCPNTPSTIDHPWRWSIGSTPLLPGASRVITGSVTLTQPGTYTFVFGLIKDWRGYPDGSCDANGDPKLNACGLQTTTITVLDPTRTPTNTRTITPTASNTSTTTSTRTPTFTRTMTEVASSAIFMRYRFNDPLGIRVNLASSIAQKYQLTCGGTILAPASRCPEIVAGGIDGNALRFTGSHNTRASSFLELGRMGTLSFWAKPNSTGSEMNVFAISNNLATVITGFDSAGRFFCSFGANSRLTSSETFNTSEWTHFVCTYNEALKQRALYINSKLVASDTVTSVPRGILMNGVFGSNVTQNGNYFRGDIDEFTYHSIYLNISQVEELYRYFVISNPARISPTRTNTATLTRTNTPFPTDYQRTVIQSARYLFNEASGATSFANALAPTKPAVCPLPFICPTAGASGMRSSNALSFTGTQGLKVSKLLSTTATAPIGIGAWINPNALSSEMVIVSAKSLTQTSKMLLGTTASGQLFCSFGASRVTSVVTIPAGDWSHVLCAVSASKQVALYVNGDRVTTGTWATMPAGTSNIDVWFGLDGTNMSAHYDGLIDEITFYKSALTWEMVEILYDQYTTDARRSPTRTRTPSRTTSPSRTLTASRTRTETLSPTLEVQGSYPYPMPVGTATKTYTNTRTVTRTSTPVPAITATAPANQYPYPVP